MALPANADIPFLLSRIRPNAEWSWKGGAANDLTQVDWRDAVQVEPVEAEYAAEQVIVDAEGVTEAVTRTAQRGRVDGLKTMAPNLLAVPNLSLAVEELLVRAGALDPQTGAILPIDEWPEVN